MVETQVTDLDSNAQNTNACNFQSTFQKMKDFFKKLILFCNYIFYFYLENIQHQVAVSIMRHKPYFLNRPKPLKAVVLSSMESGSLVYTLRSQSDNPGYIIKYRMFDSEFNICDFYFTKCFAVYNWIIFRFLNSNLT